ncbi:chymotrypsinogen B-like [Glandiceps talaboti]
MTGLILPTILFVKLTGYPMQESGCGDDHFQLGFDGAFTSMNFNPEGDVRYDPNAFCHWTLETSEVFGQAIELSFHYFRVENSINCVYDSVTAFDGARNSDPILRLMCGHSTPNPTVSSRTIMLVEFVTDFSVQYYGFNATWRARDWPIECETNVAFRCGDDENGYCIPIDERCDGVADCPLSEDEDGCPDNSVGCGIPEIEPVLTPPPSTNVIGGYEAVPGSWPWMVSLMESFEQTCGGSILNDHWVITAASCVFQYNSNPQVFDVISGNHDLDDNDPFEKSHDVSEIFVHPDYSPLKDEYNFALLRVRGKIVFNDAATLDICRPNRGDLFPGATEVWATGWGDTVGDGSARSRVLRQNNMTVYSQADCNEPDRYDGAVTDSLLCAGSSTVDTCEGDEGGPLMWYRPVQDAENPNPDDERWYLIGITGDRGDGCGTPDLFGLYGRVASAIDWIEEIMQNN